MKLILASGSPRRRELLEMLGAEFEVIPAKGEEVPHPELSPAELVKALSRAKAEEVAAAHPEALVIGADTVVAIGSCVLGKPQDEADAAEMLRRLSGCSHKVYTGISIVKNGVTHSHAEETDVRFAPMSEEDIAAYIATGEPMDKAGAYGIQGRASLFIEGIEGDFFNVMGLPVCALGKMLRELGISLSNWK